MFIVCLSITFVNQLVNEEVAALASCLLRYQAQNYQRFNTTVLLKSRQKLAIFGQINLSAP